MFKYPVENYESFQKCMSRTRLVYIDKPVKNYPIPDLYGLIFPFIKDNKIVIAVFTVDNNTHIPSDEFEKMLINVKFPGDVNVNMFTLDDTLDIYEHYSNDYKMFVLDDIIERNIEINN